MGNGVISNYVLALVENWDGPKRRFMYMFVPGDNNTLEIVELEHPRDFYEGLPRNLELHECPGEVAAEINISMGYAGLMAMRPSRWGKVKGRLWLFKQRWHMRWIKLTRRPV